MATESSNIEARTTHHFTPLFFICQSHIFSYIFANFRLMITLRSTPQVAFHVSADYHALPQWSISPFFDLPVRISTLKALHSPTLLSSSSSMHSRENNPARFLSSATGILLYSAEKLLALVNGWAIVGECLAPKSLSLCSLFQVIVQLPEGQKQLEEMM